VAKPRRPALAVHRPDVAPIAPPPRGRGRLYYDFQIPDEFFSGMPGVKNKVRWVREHLPRAKRIKVGGASAWYESDIQDFIESQREQQRLDETRKAASGE
jgi:hypothetical protein